MKIGISTSVIQRGRSGVAQYVFALLRSLRAHAAEHEFTVFALEEDLPKFEYVRDVMNIVTVPERFRRPVADIAWHHTALPRLAAQHKLDVIHIPSYRRMMRSAPCARVATIHDLAPFHVAGKYDWMRMFYGRVVARQLARSQDQIIAVSGTTARDIDRFFAVDPGRVMVVHNGIDHNRFNPGSQAQAKLWAAQRGVDRPFFLYVARLEHPGKNHVRLIEAFNRFKAQTRSDWQLVLGGADWHGSEVIHDRINRSAYSADIRRLGFVSDAELPQWYRAADAFIYPSLFEGFGFPPLEAMACGCPVVCSPRGALAEVTGTAAAVVDPEDIGGMQWQLARLATDGAWRATLRAAGLKHAENFDWSRTAASTLEAYERALAAPSELRSVR